MRCPVCDEPLSEGQPRFHVTFSADDENSEDDQQDVEICEQCFERYQTALF